MKLFIQKGANKMKRDNNKSFTYHVGDVDEVIDTKVIQQYFFVNLLGVMEKKNLN